MLAQPSVCRGQVVLTPVRIQRGDAVRAKLAELVFGKGATARLRVAWQDGRCIPLVSTAALQELVRGLAYPKFKLVDEDQRELLTLERVGQCPILTPETLLSEVLPDRGSG